MIVIFFTVNIGWLAFYLYGRFDGNRMYQRVKNNKKVYVNDVYRGAINSAMYVSNINDSNLLIDYYSKIEKGNQEVVINFPIKMLPYNKSLFLIDNSKYSKVSEVVYIDTLTGDYDYQIGFVYKGTVHINPPDDSLLIEKDKFIESLNQ